jgi:uncharacterized protein (DUF4415 family)
MKKKFDDIPHLTENQILNAPTGAERRKRGRPPGSNKTQINVRIDNDILKWLKRAGRGYQTKLNEVLRKIMELSNKR